MKIKYIIILLVLFYIFLNLLSVSYANIVSNDLENTFFRLHIIANSNSESDQNLKLKVRDNILEYMNTLSFNQTSKGAVMQLAIDNIDNFKEVAQKTVLREGFNYDVKVSIGNYFFPEKNYEDITLPTGFYDALKIELGNAEGKNWWCCLYPPLCFADFSTGILTEEGNTNLMDNLNKEELEIIKKNNNPIKIKFKIIELFSK